LAGADYCLKVTETSPEEKLSLVEAFLNETYRLDCCKLILDQDRMCIYGNDQKLEISFIEMKVLEALIYNRLLSHDEIANVMGLNTKFYDSRALEKSISRLRSKIKGALWRKYHSEHPWLRLQVEPWDYFRPVFAPSPRETAS